MKQWYTYGAFGDCVTELTIWEWLGLLFGREIEFDCVVISLGRSKRKPLDHRQLVKAKPGITGL